MAKPVDDPSSPGQFCPGVISDMPRISVGQQTTAQRIRLDLPKLLALLVPEIRGAPLLDKRDLPRLAKLGGTMDAALRFESFRCNIVGNLACDVFSRSV